MEWLVALSVLGLALAALPMFLRTTKRSSAAKGRLGGAVLAIGLALWAVLDPSSRTATEEIDRNRSRQKKETAEDSD